MAHGDRLLSRRSIVAGAGVGFGAGLLGSAAAAATAGGSKIWSGEYWAQKGSVKLYLFRKRAGAPKAGEKARPVLFLVHGSSMSSRSTFDLTVPGKGEYSLMDAFVRRGFEVWTMDHENYGRSSRTEGNSDIKSGVEDLKAAMEVVARETGQKKAHLFGESSGGLRAGAYAMVAPERVDRLVLTAFTYKGEGSPTLAERGKQLEFFRTHNRRPRDRNMILGIFTRDKAGTTDPAVAEAVADAELKFGNEAPTGTYLDMTANLPVVDPAKVQAPVLLLRGEYDGIATVEDLTEFYKRLPNGDRQFAILPAAAHSVCLGVNRRQFWHVMHAFLAMPPLQA
jgi:alpha-beta hydrolase superfamily lysophospholipase